MHKEREQDRPHPGKICGDLVQTNGKVTAVGLMEQREYTVVCAPGEMRSGSVNASLSKQRQLQSASDSLRKVSKD